MWCDVTWMCQECSSVVGSAAFAGRPGIVKYAHCQTCGDTTRQTAEAAEDTILATSLAEAAAGTAS